MRARENPVLKAGAFLLAVVTFAIAAVMGCYQMVNLNVIWGNRSATCWTSSTPSKSWGL